jgi:hypothetical protein
MWITPPLVESRLVAYRFALVAVGVDSVWEHKKLEARKMLENSGESHMPKRSEGVHALLDSFRSDWGARGYAALATVLNTAKRHGQSPFQKLVAMMGQPVLPFIEATV